jgi:signal transduction histidine kinase
VGTGLPLRVVLPLVAVGLVAAGASAVALAGVSAARGYLMRQVDQDLAVCASGLLSQPVQAVPGSSPASGLVLPGPCDAELLSADRQRLTSAVPGAPAGRTLPALVGRPATVPGTGTAGGWRVIMEAVHYQPRRILFVYGPDDFMYVIGGRTEPGPAGLLVVMTGLAGVGHATGQVAADYAAAAAAVLVALAAAALALVRAVLRPLRQPGELTHAAGGEPRPIRASRAAEAAARQSTAEMAAHLDEVALELRRSVSVVRGFAEYCRQRDPRPSADLDRMAGRAAEEATRIEMLIERLTPP